MGKGAFALVLLCKKASNETAALQGNQRLVSSHQAAGRFVVAVAEIGKGASFVMCVCQFKVAHYDNCKCAGSSWWASKGSVGTARDTPASRNCLSLFASAL